LFPEPVTVMLEDSLRNLPESAPSTVLLLNAVVPAAVGLM